MAALPSSSVDGHGLAIAAFVVGTAGNTFKAVPQFVRTAVGGLVAGLSTTAVWLAFTSQVLWLCFGVAIADWRFVALGAVQTVLTAGTLTRFVGKTGVRHNLRHAATLLPACGVFVIIAATGTGIVLESLGVALGVAIGAPQLIYLWRRRRQITDVSGVSQVEYAVVITAQVAWMSYWLLQGHPIAAAGAAWGGAARSVTLGLLRQQTSRAARASEDVQHRAPANFTS